MRFPTALSVALTNSMKIILSQFQISTKNRHYKMVNTSFLFLFLASLKIDQKMTQRISGKGFLLLWSSPKLGRKIPQRNDQDLF